jgi:hypothetical protein
VALAWRLGGPWATLGPPKGHPNPIAIRQRVATPKTQIATGIPLRRKCICFPKYQVLNTKYLLFPILPCILLDFTRELVHQHRSLPSTTLCLTSVHVFSTRVGQLTAYSFNFQIKSWSAGAPACGTCVGQTLLPATSRATVSQYRYTVAFRLCFNQSTRAAPRATMSAKRRFETLDTKYGCRGDASRPAVSRQAIWELVRADG